MLGKKVKALGNETSLSTSRFAQAQTSTSRWKNITLDVEGDADRFACELHPGIYRKASDKKAAHGKHSKDEWNTGGDWPKVWRVYGKMVGSELTALNAPKVLGKLPDITFWACNILMEDRSEIVSSKLSKGKDASSGRWTNVAYAKQVVGRSGSNCALRILHRCTKYGFMSKDDSMWFLMRKRSL